MKDPAKSEEKAYLNRRRLASALSLLALLAFFLLLALTLGRRLLDLAGEPERFQIWVEQKGWHGRLAMIGVVFFQVVVAIVPGELVEVAAGYAFGAIEGMLLCLVGVALGSATVFAFIRRFGLRMAEAFVSREKINSLSFMKNEKRLNYLIFLLFFIPGTPKDMLTYFVGLTPIRLVDFLILTTIARIPSVITSTAGGAALGSKDISTSIILFAVTGAISAAGLLVYQRIKRRGRHGAGEKNEK
jgi:uncharacterized membrane protein YdjX (TVP38/TMEM64 family)